MAAAQVRAPSPSPREVDSAAALMSCDPRGGTPPKEVRVAVLNSSYEGSESPMKDYDDLNVGPHHYIGPEHGDENFKITVHKIKKATAYREIRALAKSGEYDVFYNLCDAGKDEDRAGVEVIQALEEFRVPFTGAPSNFYEPSKMDMKMVAHYSGIQTPRFAYVESRAEAERKCTGLKFPLLIKHPSGYSSVGMTKDCKCADMPSLLSRLDLFLEEYQSALIEEFISGAEATILCCADDTQPDGVRVFTPVTINFPDGEDFKHFDLKWVNFEGMEWTPVPESHKSYQKMVDCARKSFKDMMGGIGYGRTDVRIDSLGEVYFLEINPQPGSMYPPGQEASTDWILKLEDGWDHRSFAILQMQQAIKNAEASRPKFYRDFDPQRGYHLRAAKTIKNGEVVLHDEGRLQRLYTKPWVMKNWDERQKQQFSTSAWPVGRDAHVYAVWETDPSSWFSYNHSCAPNMRFDCDRSLNVIASRAIDRHEELTMDYTTFMDKTSSEFDCYCGSSFCKKRIKFEAKPHGMLESPLMETVVARSHCSPPSTPGGSSAGDGVDRELRLPTPTSQ